MEKPDRLRPQDGLLVIGLYGKLADLIHAESGTREMSPDRLVADIIWCWYTDLRNSRRRSLGRPAESIDERIGDVE
jgi:hypothetical protein